MQHRLPSNSKWETLEGRQLLSGTIDFLDTSGPAAHTGDDPRGVITTDVNGDGKLDLLVGNCEEAKGGGDTVGHVFVLLRQ